MNRAAIEDLAHSMTGIAMFDAMAADPQATAHAGPGWIKVAPRGRFTARDGRSFEVDPEMLVSRFRADGIDVPIDIDHATVKKAAFGESAPAVGWIVELQARADGLYGRVGEWLAAGLETLKARTHRYVSPSLKTDDTGRALWLHSVALVAAPAASMPAIASASPSHPDNTQPQTLGSSMLLNSATLSSLYIGFKSAFQSGFDNAKAYRDIVAMTVKSSTREEEYGWLGGWPSLREWVGPRHIKSLETHGFKIKNRDWESTVSVERNAVEDDTVGIFTPRFREMGRAAKQHPDTLVFELLRRGFTEVCYDGQYFFDAEHQVSDADGVMINASNIQAGAGAAWFLVDASRAIKPIIFQERRDFQFTAKDHPDDDNTFFNKEFIYGIDSRSNVGFGLWQLAFGSKATLDATNYSAARTAMMNLRGDNGLKLNIQPTHMIVPPSLESAGRKLLNSENAAGGETNEWKGTAELIVTSFVAD